MAAVEQLGSVNGQALACRQVALSSQARNALIAVAPKTREVGEAFEAATNKAFLAPGGCGDRKRLAAEVDAAIVALRIAYPATRHDTAVLAAACGRDRDPLSAAGCRRPCGIGPGFSRTLPAADLRLYLVPGCSPDDAAGDRSRAQESRRGCEACAAPVHYVDPERDTPAVLKTYRTTSTRASSPCPARRR